MKALIITKSKLSLARALLSRPVMTIGRSPTCDVVLRAPGVAPFHFILEWVGAGAFDPSRGVWSVFDISESGGESGEGQVLGPEAIELGGFAFEVQEDRLEAEWGGGKIQASLTPRASDSLQWSAKGRPGELLEVVQSRRRTGAIEEVLHVKAPRRRRTDRPLEMVHEFALAWRPGGTETDVLKVLLEEMPNAEVYRKGQRLQPQAAPILRPGDILEVRWKDYAFYMRLVTPTKLPRVPLNLLQDRLLTGLGALGVLFGLAVYAIVARSVTEEPLPPPPRIATIQVLQAAAPPPPPELPKKELPPPKPKPEVAGIKQAAKKEAATAKPPGQASAPSVKPVIGKPQIGLNTPAPAADVNTMGLLGALKKGGGAKGSGVSAELLKGVVTSAVSGSEGNIAVQSAPMGDLGVGTGGSPRGDGSGLAKAGTTLQGSGVFDPKSTGPIGREGGKSGYSVGSGLGAGGAGVAVGDLGGKMDTGSLQVSGGLSREVVKEVIARYRAQIRTCYERALLTNPSLAGRVVYRWDISPAGPVMSAVLTKSDAESPVLESCVLAVIKSMMFPVAESGKSTTVIYPFVFQAQSR